MIYVEYPTCISEFTICSLDIMEMYIYDTAGWSYW